MTARSMAVKPTQAALPAVVALEEAEAAADLKKVESMTLGGMLVDPARNCGAVAAAHGAPAFAHWREITPGNVADALEATIEAVRGGDMSALEAMLVSQAFAMQSIFTDCATRARAQNSREASATLMAVAMKAQAQCRATVQTIGELKAPRSTIFAKNASINNGGQQQNNYGVDAHAHAPAREEMQPAQNKVLTVEGSTHVLDAGTPRATGRIDSQLAAVGSIDRTTHRRGQRSGGAER